MSIIEEKANSVAAALEQKNVEHRVAFDPLMILTIVEVIVFLVKLYKKGNKTAQEAHQSMQSLGLVERWHLRRAIRIHLNDQEMHDHIGDKLFDGLAETAAGATEDDVSKAFEQA